MADVLVVTASKLCNPVSFFVIVVAGDGLKALLIIGVLHDVLSQSGMMGLAESTSS